VVVVVLTVSIVDVLPAPLPLSSKVAAMAGAAKLNNNALVAVKVTILLYILVINFFTPFLYKISRIIA
jgi:hypothetical protein